MFEPRIKISKHLYDELAKAAVAQGYSSTDEFVQHVLEKASLGAKEAESEEEVKKRLKGLGYLG